MNNCCKKNCDVNKRCNLNFNHGTKHETLIAKGVCKKFKRVLIKGSSKMKTKKRQEFAIIVAPKAILQENVTRKNKIGRKNSKVFHK
jgi:hypothetical protein